MLYLHFLLSFKKNDSKKEDEMGGQHFNLTQIPFDVENDEHNFLFDYHIAIAFEIRTSKWSKEVIMDKVKARLSKRKIGIGKLIGEPIAITSFHKSTT